MARKQVEGWPADYRGQWVNGKRGTGEQGEAERWGEGATGGRRDGETGRRGDRETRRQGDDRRRRGDIDIGDNKGSPCVRLPVPSLPVSLSFFRRLSKLPVIPVPSLWDSEPQSCTRLTVN